jgi:hypothetical protein
LAVPANSYGIVVEGPYDVAVFYELIPRILDRRVPVIPRPCYGKENLRKDLLIHLKTLEFAAEGRAVEKALVIRDSGGKKPKIIEAELTQKVREQPWAFSQGVHVCIIRREVETWLLADVEEGINAVAKKRGGREVAEVQGTLEEIEYPKERLKQLLSEAKLEYTERVCGEIARSLRLDTLSYRCPSFRTFKQRVVDC